jgi:salicylate hydroxylase
MPPNMTKVFNYWGMRDRLDEIGIVTDRVIMSRRTRCSPSRLSHPLTASPHYCAVETAYLLGIHSWEHEMLQEAGGEFMALCVRTTRIDLLGVFLSNSAWPSPRHVAGDGS